MRASHSVVETTAADGVTRIGLVDVDHPPPPLPHGQLQIVTAEPPPEASAEQRRRLGSNVRCGACALCAIPVRISYRDVLILEQFMRADGTVLPPEFTGLLGGLLQKY